MSTISVTKHEESTVTTVDLVLYILCAYGFAWLIGGVVLFLNLPSKMIPVAASSGPLIGAVITTIRTSGSEGIRNFFISFLNGHFSPIWYVAALLIPFAVISVSIGVAVMFKGAQVPDR